MPLKKDDFPFKNCHIFCKPRYGTDGGGGLETCGATLALNEMLLQSHEGALRFFPVWPVHRSASFETLRAKGAFLVSAEYDGATQLVRGVNIVSEAGGNCTLFAEVAPTVKTHSGVTVVVAAAGKDKWRFATEAGQAYTLMMRRKTDDDDANRHAHDNGGIYSVGCPTSPTFQVGVIGKGLSQDCELELPTYGSGACPGPACESYQGYWSAEGVIKEHFPDCPKASWPAAWLPAELVKLRHGCNVVGWQQTPDGLYCPDPTHVPLPCPGLNVSFKDNVAVSMATCHQSGSTAVGNWGGFDAVADYLGQQAVVNVAVCSDKPAITDAITRYVCPVWTAAMSQQASAYPTNLPTVSAINRTCGLKNNTH